MVEIGRNNKVFRYLSLGLFLLLLCSGGLAALRCNAARGQMLMQRTTKVSVHHLSRGLALRVFGPRFSP